MYKQVKTHESAILDNGVEFKPVATLENDAGGVCHISVDDHCYKLSLKQENGTFKVTPYIFGEAFEVLRRLPPLILDVKTINTDISNRGFQYTFEKTLLNRIENLKNLENKMTLSELEADITKLVHKYYSGRPGATIKDVNFSINLIRDIIEHPYFYTTPN